MKAVKKAPGRRPGLQILSKTIGEVLRSPTAGQKSEFRGFRPTVLCASGGAILGTALAVTPVTPVSAQDETLLEEVTVTGSRIPRRDFTANAPIQTVDESMFDETTAIGVETILNRLPQFVPAVTQFTTTDVQQTATNTVGVSTVSLRGLGPNRNLVLINGRRAMPVDPTMVVDTNSIPSSAIARVEVISGGASAVYGADAVGGVVNFVLKDDFEGASVDIRFGDTQHGGNQEITISGLIGANMAGDRGNVMLGVERATRTVQRQWERDWRVADFADPSAPGGTFVWGSTPWIRNETTNTPTIPLVDTGVPNPNYDPNLPIGPAGRGNQQTIFVQNYPAQNPDELANRAAWPNQWTDQTPTGTVTTVDEIFSDAPLITLPGGVQGTVWNNIDAIQYRMNDDGTIFTGAGVFQDGAFGSGGSYRFNGPLYSDINGNLTGQSGDHQGSFQGLPVFVMAPNGYIKENNLYQWASSPLERLSSFATGHFDVSDNVRVTAQANITRTKTESSLGATAANINQWAAAVPFGNELYRGNNTPLYPGDNYDRSIYDIPDSLVEIDANGDGVIDPNDPAEYYTNPAYRIDGRFGVECDAQPTAEMPWLDGMPGCTMSEAWPTSAEIYNLFMSRPDPNRIVWGNRSPDYLREAIGNGRSTTNQTTTMQLSLGAEGELPSGNDFWDVTFSTGRSDNIVNQLGSVRLSSLRALYLVPNYGRGAVFDPNPTDDGFAESNPTCTTGLPIIERFVPSQDCVQIIAPSLKNQREVTQSIFEANLVGDLAEIPAGPLQYALGLAYRENSYLYTPDNLSDNANFLDPIAGTYPNEVSGGEFDVSEIYGELLIPVVSDGPAGVEHFTFELGGRVSDWSMPNMPNLETYKALVDWGITPRYRLRGGFNRAFRAPNLGELFIARTQVFGGFGSADHCSQNLDPGERQPWSASSTDATQAQNAYQLCRQLMGVTGAIQYYDTRPLEDQTTGGGTGVAYSTGNISLREEQADTFTLGMVMDFHDNFTLTVDYYKIELDDMIALESADAIYQTCLDPAFNPTFDPNADACVRINRNPADGGASNVERTFDNQGAAVMEGVDLQFDWSRDLANGGFSLNSVANIGLKSTTQERPDLPVQENSGYNDCDLQIQCQRYEYRIFTTMSYFRGPWNLSLRHQYWPELEHSACANAPESVTCIYSSYPAQNLVSATFGYTFRDRYRINLGIENLLDKDPPCVGANPNRNPYPFTCDHNGTVPGDLYNSTFDLLGRRYFLSMTMDF